MESEIQYKIDQEICNIFKLADQILIDRRNQKRILEEQER